MKPRLVWIGSPFFSNALPACGWDVYTYNFEHEAVLSWVDIVQLAGGEPDVLVVADKSRPPFVLGMERFPCLTFFYAVDTHIHSWYPLYAQAFDGCLVSLKDHLDDMRGKRLNEEALLWSPAFAPDTAPLTIPTAKRWDCLFVGTVNPQTTPKRVCFLQELGQYVPLHVTRGDYCELYPKARVVLNFCEYGDLNFRVFEAMGCGACLVTPEVEHGFSQLFTSGKQLLTYPSCDVQAAAQVIQSALRQPALCSSIAEAGLAAVNAEHRATHRAQAFTAFALRLMSRKTCVEQRLSMAANIHSKYLQLLYLHLAEAVPHTGLRTAYLQAAKALLH